MAEAKMFQFCTHVVHIKY